MAIFVIFHLFTQTIPDFQVNSEDYVSKATQYYPAIASYDSGSTVLWYDWRLRDYGMSVFGARLNIFADTIGANLLFDDDTTIINCLSYPDVGCDFEGNFTAVWIEHYNTICRRFQTDGTPIGRSFVINDFPGNCYGPAIAVDSLGRTVVSWSDNHEFNKYRIYGQIYDELGNSVGANFSISDSSQNLCMISDVAMNSKQEFIAVWAYNYDIWCQRFDSLGNRIGENFTVWHDTINIGEGYPTTEYNRSGDFCVAWSWSTVEQGNIYCRLFDSTDTPITDVIKLNETLLTHSWRPKVTNFDDSIWCVVWEDSLLNIYIQRISNNGTLIGNNLQINAFAGIGNRYADIDLCNDNIVVTWARRMTHFVWDIMVQLVSPDGNLIGPNKSISDDRGGAAQLLPSVVADTTGDFFVVWDDTRDPETHSFDQHGRRFDQSGSPLCDDFRINEYKNATFSSISLNNLGLYVTIWTRTDPDSNRQVYGQRFDRNGVPLGPNFQISQAPGDVNIETSRICALADNTFIVVWSDQRVQPARIYGRTLDALGIPCGNEFTTYIDSTVEHIPWAIIDEKNSKFLLCMNCYEESIAVAIQAFDYGGNPLSAPMILNEIPSAYPVSGAKGINRYLFAWPDSAQKNIYGQFLDDSLQKIGNNLLVNDDTILGKSLPCVVSNQHGQFFVIWQQGDYEYEDLYGQFFDSLGNKIDSNFRVDNDTTNYSQRMPYCYSTNNLIYIVWSDRRNPAQEHDIYCKVIEWPEIGIAEHETRCFQHLLTVSPNPFREKIDIKYTTHDTGCKTKDSSLKIYDVCGRLVKNYNLQIEIYNLQSIEWDGTDDTGNILPAGVYFMKFNSESSAAIKKLVKIK